MSRWRGLAVNMALALGVSVAFLGILEGGFRIRERLQPPPPIAQFFSDLELRRDGGWYTVATDSVGWPPGQDVNPDGLRDVAHAPEKPGGVVRIAALGDSVTLGAGAEPAEAWPQQLQQRLAAEGRPVEVSSVALWGWSTREERMAYGRIARRYQPDVVLLAVCLNDVPETLVDLPPAWIPALHRRSALVRALVDAGGREMREVRALFEPGERGEKAWARFFEEVRALAGEVRADGGRLGLLVLPFRFQLEAGAPPPVPQRRIATFAQEAELPVLDLLPALQPLGAPAAFIDHDHLTPAGAAAVAGAVGTWLEPQLPPPAARVLAGAGVDAVNALGHPDPAVRAAGAWVLGGAGSDDGATSALAEALGSDPAERVRLAAADALGRMGRAARLAVPALLAALADPSQAVRWAAARALDAIGHWPASALPHLTRALGADDAYVRAFGAWGLAELEAHATPAVPALRDQLARGTPPERRLAAQALGRIGEHARDAVPDLLDALRSPDVELRWRAARALGRIGARPDLVVPALVTALDDPRDPVRAQAARALGRFGPDASAALPKVRTLVDDADPAVRGHARGAAEAIAAGQRLD